jgi:hypothetical protein
MPADPSAAKSDDRPKLCLTWPPARRVMAHTAAQCVYTRGLAQTFRHPRSVTVQSGRPQDWTRNLAPSISLLRVIAERADS